MLSVSLWLSDSVRRSGISDGVATDGIDVVSDLFSACEQALKLLAAIKMAKMTANFFIRHPPFNEQYTFTVSESPARIGKNLH